MLKKFYILFLIAALVMPFGASYIYLKHKKQLVKKSVKHSLMESVDRDELVKLSFNKDEISKLKWEHSKEFEFKGKMYDIVETIISGDIITYYCWLDKEETILNDRLDELVTEAFGQSQTKDENYKALKKIAKTLYFVEDIFRINKKENINEFGFYTSISNYKSINLNLDSPPPEIIS